MLFDLITTASSVSVWPVTLPPKLKTAIQVFDESAFIEYAAFPPKVDTITVKNLAEVAVGYARERAVEAVWPDAKNMIRRQLAQRVLATAQECADDIRKAESVEFDKVVATFVENAVLLPDSLDSADLIRAGGDVVNAYHKAADAATRLDRWDSWVASLYGLSKWAADAQEPDLRIVEPANRSQYQELVNAKSDSGIRGAYLYAARNGVPFKLHLPDEITALRDRLNAEPAQSRFPGAARLVRGADGIDRLVKADGSPVAS